MNRVPMTARGAEALKVELQELKTVARPRVIEAIAEARAHGDLKENAEYHAAREQQGFIEGRIAEIEAKLSNAQIIDVSKLTNDGKVIFGTTVVLSNTENGNEMTYRIVGEDEADIKNGLINIGSPIARALVGKFEGDVVVVKTPGGDIEYEIVEVKYE
ncbi:transcription elongation factor GreA [Permianibacter aggregans]|uniref:Transcription elongation factor GreA n=1 Tax=Permianibacter aggregans TaxID=1510150 RepID=A0A4R6UKX0_9GAMM|nr:transcription elongation factor GreA [Permianibacter aggregans]QGX40565.1 transcription elongation factor GreA [Permianibacter aggregans]TDQ43874.1 transcription elongation factor GreA [Permianibacter aggregans]